LHKQKIDRVIEQLKEHRSTGPVSFRKKTVSHEVPKLFDKRYSDEKIDISDLTEVISIDTEAQTCTAEPGITFADLVKATMKHGLVPIVVPELETITIGGAVAGCSLESMSFRYGGFHDTCLEYEIITANGDVLTCTPDNEHSLLFQMVHGTFGTLGIISQLKFRLIPSKPFVKVTFEQFDTLADYKSAIWEHYRNQDVDFMDGIIHTPSKYVLSTANFVDSAPYTHKYNWTRIYYKSTGERKEDYLETPYYFFRYNNGVTNVNPKSFIARLLIGKLTNSTRTLKFVDRFRRFIPEHKIPVTMDMFIPFSKVSSFMEWYEKEIGHFPLWCVPYKAVRKYEWLSSELLNKTDDELFIDLAVYGMPKDKDKNYYRMFEEKLLEIDGIKTLISNNYYSETDFWKTWNKENYYAVKQRTDPDNIFRNLYTKTCRTVMGLEE